MLLLVSLIISLLNTRFIRNFSFPFPRLPESYEQPSEHTLVLLSREGRVQRKDKELAVVAENRGVAQGVMHPGNLGHARQEHENRALGLFLLRNHLQRCLNLRKEPLL